MENTKQIMDILICWIGMSVLGFLALAGWMWWLIGEMAHKVSYESLNKNVDKIQGTLNQIKDALVGNLDNGNIGLIARTTKIEEYCELCRKRG